MLIRVEWMISSHTKKIWRKNSPAITALFLEGLTHIRRYFVFKIVPGSTGISGVGFEIYLCTLFLRRQVPKECGKFSTFFAFWRNKYLTGGILWQRVRIRCLVCGDLAELRFFHSSKHFFFKTLENFLTGNILNSLF